MSNQEATAGTAEATTQTRIPGTFCWWEAGTTDQNAAKKFYSDLIGWTINDVPIGPDMIYTMFQVDGKDVTALYQMDENMVSQGIPPHWMSYVLVENADEAAAKATAAGGTVMQAPFDVMEHGRMAVLQDPQGAVFALWEAKSHWGVCVRDEDGALCWNELATKDPEGSRNFYTSLMGWNAKTSPDYTEWHLGDEALGGMRTIRDGEPTPPNWMPYFMVNDVDATTKKVTAGGGVAHIEPRDMMGVGRFSVVGDPQGAVFALFKPAM